MEIIFKADKKHRDKYFTATHFEHPAKMVLPLQRWLIENYTKPSDIILDPMAGCGTVLIACTMGRHVITVELENKFIVMQNENWAKIQTLGPEMGYSMGMATILQGDARNLPDMLADVVISSPPYEAVIDGVGEGPLVTSKKNKSYKKMPSGYDTKVDVVISSPPYEGSDISQTHMTSNQRGDPSNSEYRPSWKRKIKDGYCETKRPYADVIMTSPPYEEAMGKKHHSPRADKLAGEKSNPVTYTDKVDVVLTSPPYEKSLGGDEESKGWEKLAQDPSSNRYGRKSHPSIGQAYSATTSDNIGNLKGESYLSAMLEVYQGCYRVLKPQGLVCLVTKNYIRNKQEIRLDLDTIKLCEQVGFELIERHYRKLANQSFWRTIYQQKYPDAPVLDKEDILVLRKVENAL